MTREGFKRKLTAILSADVIGYSRLMRDDEEATVRSLAAHRVLVTEIIQQHHGRIVDSPGDNILAEFASVVDAVNGAIKIQEEIKRFNIDTPEDRRMEFRVGINLGDVIEEKERIYGDGVNIAARVEGLSLAGGISISGTVYEHIKDKLSLGYHYLGEQNVKNIPEPVRVYRLLTDPNEVGKMIGKEISISRKFRYAIFSALAVIILVAGALIIWNNYIRLKIEPASVDRMAYPLPDKPSIAVLPFDNLSGDPEQEYFSDGITDDLITDLSKISGLFVIARNSTFTYKGKAIKIQQVSEELGVRYVLEGSVRKAGERVRINAQLIDATTSGHLWAERYEGKLSDVFTLQDKVTQNIVAALAVTLTVGEKEHVRWSETNNVAAYDSFLQGWNQYVERTPKGFAEAAKHFKNAIELDPKYGRAYAALASTYWECSHRFWSSILGVTWGKARHLAEQYLEKAMQYPTTLAHQIASRMLVDWQQYDNAIEEAERAIVLDPSDPDSYRSMAYAMIYAGKPQRAVSFAGKSMRLDPHYPAYNLFVLGLAYFSMERFEIAVTSFQRALSRNPENNMVLIYLSAAYALSDRLEEAKATIAELKKSLPMMTVQFIMGSPVWRYKNRSDNERLREGLRKAGLS
jgi:TolB-like protein/class 3 adenylate cyclase/Flp pilus assembly protein TadD